MNKSSKVRWLAAAAMLVLVFSLLAACSSADSNRSSSMASSNESAGAAGGEMAEMSNQKGESLESLDTQADAMKTMPSVEGAEGGSTPAGNGAGMAQDVGAFDRKLIYKANLTMEVESFDTASTELRNAIHQGGGYILQFQDSRSGEERGSTYTIKVPADGFMPFLDRLAKIKHTRFEQSLQGTDVSEEYVDLESRLKAKQVVEGRLLAFMDKAQKADDLLKFSNQLGTIQEEIEQLKGRIRYLDQNVAFSTIELRLYQPSDAFLSSSKSEQGMLARMGEALKDSTHVLLQVLQALLVFVSGALPVLIFLAILGLPAIWLYRRWQAERSKRSTPPSTPSPTPPSTPSPPDA
ncbi:DUF4349 domain-containing protein [Paenibacillus sp. GCM10023252]|uniref:DUF4349 domain-containing protein n=1 Tax=Paenibacillus sp. GCM10023252 TaxID=3252649 RepID=UPI00361ECD27